MLAIIVHFEAKADKIDAFKEAIVGHATRCLEREPGCLQFDVVQDPKNPAKFAVYEIYKVGEDVHTKQGLDLFNDFGVMLSFIPHWNNAEGGTDLDTSRCFVGMERFAEWSKLVPSENTILGLDEHTGIVMDFESGMCEIMGVSSVSLMRDSQLMIHPAGVKFSLSEVGTLRIPNPLRTGISQQAWDMVLNAPALEDDSPPPGVVSLAEQRFVARLNKNWAESDKLRDDISALGWIVQDAKDGYKLVRN